jgi:transcriptional regulator with XRE-family HTH domain
MKMPAPGSPIPRNLRRLRERAGLTQAQLAELSDTTDATISRIERGRFLPSQQLLDRLAKAIQVDPSELVTRAKKPTKPQLRPCEARLLATVRGLPDTQVEDVVKGLRLIMAASGGRNS